MIGCQWIVLSGRLTLHIGEIFCVIVPLRSWGYCWTQVIDQSDLCNVLVQHTHYYFPIMTYTNLPGSLRPPG